MDNETDGFDNMVRTTRVRSHTRDQGRTQVKAHDRKIKTTRSRSNVGFQNKKSKHVMSDKQYEKNLKEAYDTGVTTGKIYSGREFYGGDYTDYQAHEVQTAEYSNNTLPWIRQLAGYEDSGVGTYTVVPEGMDNDIWWREDELLDKYWEGVAKGFED